MRCVLSILVLLSSVAAVAAEPPAASMAADVEKAIVQKTNHFRAEHDLPALSKDDDLSTAAAEFARFMAETGKYGHHADGKSPAKRVKAAGYKYCVVRENIAYRTNTGEVTADSLTDVFMQGWIDSPPHRENMLAKYVSDTGVGIATSDETTYYAVALFGRPESASITLLITNESEQVQTLVIEVNGGKDEIEIPPRGGLKMTRCFPTELSLKGQDAGVELDESAELVIDDTAIKRTQ